MEFLNCRCRQREGYNWCSWAPCYT